MNLNNVIKLIRFSTPNDNLALISKFYNIGKIKKFSFKSKIEDKAYRFNRLSRLKIFFNNGEEIDIMM